MPRRRDWDWNSKRMSCSPAGMGMACRRRLARWMGTGAPSMVACQAGYQDSARTRVLGASVWVWMWMRSGVRYCDDGFAGAACAGFALCQEHGLGGVEGRGLHGGQGFGVVRAEHGVGDEEGAGEGSAVAVDFHVAGVDALPGLARDGRRGVRAADLVDDGQPAYEQVDIRLEQAQFQRIKQAGFGQNDLSDSILAGLIDSASARRAGCGCGSGRARHPPPRLFRCPPGSATRPCCHRRTSRPARPLRLPSGSCAPPTQMCDQADGGGGEMRQVGEGQVGRVGAEGFAKGEVVVDVV